MILAVDAGNTNIVFALVDGGAIRARWRIATDPGARPMNIRSGCTSCWRSKALPGTRSKA